MFLTERFKGKKLFKGKKYVLTMLFWTTLIHYEIAFCSFINKTKLYHNDLILEEEKCDYLGLM